MFIILDLDNTLVDRVEAFRKWAKLFIEVNDLEDATLPLIENIDADGFLPRNAFAEKLCEELKLNKSVHDVLKFYVEHYPRCFTLADDVKAALQRLSSKGHVLGILTNGPTFQNDVVTSTGLDKFVHGWVVSADVNIRKPDPGIANILAVRLGQDLKDSLVVGDSEADIILAQNLGIPAIWLTRGRDWSHPLFAPTYSVDNFDSVALIVDGL